MNRKQINGYEQEIAYQKKMLKNLSKWMTLGFFVSTIGVLIIALANQLFLTILGYAFTACGAVACLLIGKAIYSGRKNVNRIIDVFEAKLKHA